MSIGIPKHRHRTYEYKYRSSYAQDTRQRSYFGFFWGCLALDVLQDGSIYAGCMNIRCVSGSFPMICWIVLTVSFDCVIVSGVCVLFTTS